MKQGWSVHLALLVIGVIHGANYSIAKIAMPEFIKPYAFILLRLGPAVILYGILFFLKSRERIQWKHIPTLALCGFFGAAFNQLTFFKGLSLTSPINAALIMILVPVFTMIMAGFFLKEMISWLKIVGVALGIGGAAYIILEGSLKTGSLVFSNGDILVFLNALSYAIYLVMIKPLTRIYHPLTVVLWTFGFGLLLSLPFGWNELMQVKWSLMPQQAILSVVYVIIFTTCITYLLNAYAMVHASATLVSAYIFVQPVFATLFATMWGSDRLTVSKLLAGSLIFAGVFLVSDPFKAFTKNKTT